MVDAFIWKSLKEKRGPRQGREEYQALLAEFKDYIAKKKEQPVSQGRTVYLRHRLEAVEAAIKYFLGTKELRRIRAGYEQEFVRRIWGAKDQ